jgi:hypothetical protein
MFSKTDWKFSKLSEIDIDSETSTIVPDKTQPLQLRGFVLGGYTALALIVGMLLGSTITLVTLHQQPLTTAISSSRSELTCGNSSEEARARGCTFDQLTVAWLPSACPRYGNDEYLSLGPWTYWKDFYGKEAIAGEDELVHMGEEDEYWSTQAEHMAHCAYMLLRVHKTSLDGGRQDWMTANATHTEHCIMALLNAGLSSPSNGEINTYGFVRYGYC